MVLEFRIMDKQILKNVVRDAIILLIVTLVILGLCASAAGCRSFSGPKHEEVPPTILWLFPPEQDPNDPNVPPGWMPPVWPIPDPWPCVPKDWRVYESAAVEVEGDNDEIPFVMVQVIQGNVDDCNRPVHTWLIRVGDMGIVLDTPGYGDLNLDGHVNLGDLLIMKENWGK